MRHICLFVNCKQTLEDCRVRMNKTVELLVIENSLKACNKGSSIYDVQKNRVFHIFPSVHSRPHGPDLPSHLWTSTRGRHEIHTSSGYSDSTTSLYRAS